MGPEVTMIWNTLLTAFLCVIGYMYKEKSGRFASTTYYMKAHPEWHDKFYAANPQDKWAGKTWSLMLPE